MRALSAGHRNVVGGGGPPYIKRLPLNLCPHAVLNGNLVQVVNALTGTFVGLPGFEPGTS